MMVVSTEEWGGGVRNQYVAAVSGSMCYTIMGAATAWPSPILIKMADGETPMVLDVPQISWMVSLMFLGHITSPLPAGYLMDMFGRKRTCLCLTIIPFISWLLIFYATSPVHLYIARFTAGLWIGVTTTVMPIYVGEISGPKLRNSLTTINNLLLNTGNLFVYVIGPFVSYYTLALACEVLTVVYFLAFVSMPESPYFFMKHKQRERAFEVLCWLRKGETEDNIAAEIKRIELAVEQQGLHKGTLNDIFFDRGNRKAILISIIYAILKRMSGSGVMQAYTSVTLPKVTFGVLDPNTCVIVIGTISLLSSLASTALAVRYRRVSLLTISCIGCAISTATIMVWFYFYEMTSTDVTGYSDILFISFAFYYSVFNIGLGPVGTSIKGEIFSTNVKALSSSLTTLVVAFSGFIMNKFYLLIDQWLGMYFNYLIFSVACTLELAFTWTYVPDTQNKTLEEVQELLRGGTKKYRNYNSTATVSGM